jgi:hypothetical protein
VQRLALALVLVGCAPEPPPASPAEPGCAAPEGATTLDTWGGDERVQLRSTGFFSVTELCGRWWLPCVIT